MLMNIAKLENYLQIDSSRYNRPSIEALNYYATRFMLTVPFENIDVQNSKPISIISMHFLIKLFMINVVVFVMS